MYPGFYLCQQFQIPLAKNPGLKVNYLCLLGTFRTNAEVDTKEF